MKIWTKALLLLMLLLVQNAAAWADSSSKITVGNPKNPVGQADALAPYILQSSWTPSDPVPPMPNQRVLAVSAPLALTDGGAGSTLTLSLTTPFTIAQGGTGQTTREAALDALMAFASVGAGDIAYYNGTHWVRLASGNGYLNNAGGTLSWLAATGAAEDEPYVTTSSSGNLTNESVLATANSNHLTLTGATFDIGTDVVTLDGSQTLTNKLFTDPAVDWDSGNGLIQLQASSFNSSLKWADWAAARILTIPDPGTDASFVMTAGAQTLAGVKTFSSAPVLSSGTITANGDTLTLPDLGNTSFAYIAGAQTLTDKTLTAPIFGTNFTLDNGSNDGTITWDAFSAARAYVIKDVGADAHFVMKSTGSSYTAGAVPYGDGSKLLFTAQGSSGQALISDGASAPAFGTLGLAGGGTNITSYTAGDLLVVNDSGALVKLPLGSNGEVLSVNTSNNPKFDWIAAGGGSGTVTSFSAGDLSPLFTTSEATATTTPALTFSLSNAGAYTVFGNNTGSTAAPSFFVPIIPASTCEFRLTLESGVAVSTSDQTAKTTVYLTPYNGNRISLFDGTNWYSFSSAEVSASLSGLTADLPYDVFAYNNSGTLTLDLVAWTNSTTRATAIAYQNGVPVKTGATTRRLVGTILITGSTGQCEDSTKFRGVCQAAPQCRILRFVKAVDTTNSWSYATAAWRSFNNSTTLGVGKIRYVAALNDVLLFISVKGSSSTGHGIGVGVDSTSSNSAFYGGGNGATVNGSDATYYGAPSAGLHDIYPLEYAGASATFYGDNGTVYVQTGLSGYAVM